MQKQQVDPISDGNQKKKCSIHQHRPFIAACFNVGCVQPLLCVKCFGVHPKDHEDNIVDIETIKEDEAWIKQYELDREQLIVKEAKLSDEKDLIIENSKKLIICNMDDIIASLQRKKESFIQELYTAVDSNQEQEQFKILSGKLAANKELLRAYNFRDANAFSKAANVKVFLEKLKPCSEELMDHMEQVLRKCQLEESKVITYKNKLMELLKNVKLSNFWATTSKDNSLNTTDFRNEVLDASVGQLKVTISHLEKDNKAINGMGLQAEKKSSVNEVTGLQNQIDTLKADTAEFKAVIIDLEERCRVISQENIALQADKKALEDEVKVHVLNNEFPGNQTLKILKLLSTDQVKFTCQTVVTGDKTVHFCVGTANGCQNANQSVWGANPYTSDSGYCAASLHSGAIDERGGFVNMKKEPGFARYDGTSNNGVASLTYGQYPNSISITNVSMHSS